MTSKDGKTPVDTVRLQDLAYAYRGSAALLAAVELGMFTVVSEGVTTLAGIAESLDITPANAERLVTACVAIGLLERDGENFRNAPDVERFLVEGKKSYAGPWLLMSRNRRDDWSRLGEYLRRKDPPRVLGLYENFTVEQARALHEATYSVGLGAGRRFARECDLSDRKLILDLGGGSGCYCIAAAQQYPGIEGIVFDLPPVAVVAREFIAQHGLSDRIRAVGGDFTADDFPAGADVGIMASNLPDYSPELVRLVLSKAHEALIPGGEMHVIGEMLWPDRSGPVGPALWGLAETFGGSTGVAHSESDVEAYMAAAGFVRVTVNEFIPGSLTRVTGTKAD